jgi:hypothetical protein
MAYAVEEIKMEFPEDVLKKAFMRANMRCQCERDTHDHGTFTCFKQIIWEHKGNANERSGWGAVCYVSPENGGKPTIENCEILCWDCYNKVKSQ